MTKDGDEDIQVEVRAATPTTVSSAYDPHTFPMPQPGPQSRFSMRGIALHDDPTDVEDDATSKKTPLFVLPLWAVLGSASVGLLCFLDSARGAAPEEAFTWLVAVASVASLQSWAGMLYTYIRCAGARFLCLSTMS